MATKKTLTLTTEAGLSPVVVIRNKVTEEVRENGAPDAGAWKTFDSCTTPYRAMPEDANLPGLYATSIEGEYWPDGEYIALYYQDDTLATLLTSDVLDIQGDQDVATPTPARTSSTLWESIFDSVREVLRSNETTYPGSLMATLANRAQDELLTLLMLMGAEIASTAANLTGDGSTQTYDLPDDFVALVPRSVRPRSGVGVTEDYSLGDQLKHVGVDHPWIVRNPTKSGSPWAFCIEVTGTAQRLKFNSPPSSGLVIEYRYYQKTPRVTAQNASALFTPWLGLLDQLFTRTLEEWCREGLEFQGEKRELWRQRAVGELVTVLGLRHLEQRVASPSVWEGFPW